MAILEENSRYAYTAIIQIVDAVTGLAKQPAYMDVRERITALAADDKYIMVAQTHTWARLGLEFLLDARAWWAIADLSNVIDPFELEVGVTLRAPSHERYLFRLLAGEDE